MNNAIKQIMQPVTTNEMGGTKIDRQRNLDVINSEQKTVFYQAKYDYYKNMLFYMIIASVMASICYWFTDCMLYGRIAFETLPARLSILPFFVLYIFVQKKHKSYKICIPCAYLVAHAIVFCTSWAVLNLENRSHANEGLMVIECIFIFLGMAAPKHYSIMLHSLILADIVIANSFIHYSDYTTIIAMHVLLIMGSEFVIMYMEGAFKDRYIAQNKITYMTIHDQLTRVYNRNILGFLCVPESHVLTFEKAGLLILDIDFFKKINDTYGHEIGDMILIRFADAICDTVRKDDIVIRWGGEEFLVILPNISEEMIKTVAKRLNKAIEENIKDYNLTASIGGTMYDGGDYHINVKRADEALYYVKEHGRNGFKIK